MCPKWRFTNTASCPCEGSHLSSWCSLLHVDYRLECFFATATASLKKSPDNVCTAVLLEFR